MTFAVGAPSGQTDCERNGLDKVKVGVLGAGIIANLIYFQGVSKMPKAEWVAVCDVVGDRAQAAVAKWNVPKAYTGMDKFLADPEIQLVVNLTHIQAHFETNMAALQAGEHIYSEKAMTGTHEKATQVIEEAKKRGLKAVAGAAAMLRPVNIKVKGLIQAGAIGRLCYVTGRDSHFGTADFDGWTTDPAGFSSQSQGPCSIGASMACARTPVSSAPSSESPVCRASATPSSPAASTRAT